MLKEQFKKQGGLALLKQWSRSGTLLPAIMMGIFVGREKTDLELMRLMAQQKTHKKLVKRYKPLLKREPYDLTPSKTNRIWVLWWQGMNQAPPIIHACIKSLKHNLTNKDLIVLDADNAKSYVHLPAYIWEAFDAGKITLTHLSDLIRTSLLVEYGGTWIDATVYCSRNIDSIPAHYFESDLFFYQTLKPGRDGHALALSSWFLSAKANHPVIKLSYELLLTYWQKENSQMDYFLLHHFLMMALDIYPECWPVPCDNGLPHQLWFNLFEPYDKRLWQIIESQSPFHKLSTKFDASLIQEDSFYQQVLSC